MRSVIPPRLYSLFLALLLNAGMSQAQTDPFVFRVDVRPPAIIFAQGFEPEGQSSNLFAHVFNGSCDLHDPQNRSGWITTMQSRDTVLRLFADALRQGRPGATHQGRNGLWLYAIAPDNTYFRVLDVMQQAVRAGEHGQQGYNRAQAGILQQLIHERRLAQQQEVVTRRIAGQNILSAIFITFDATSQQVIALPDTGMHNLNRQVPATQMPSQVNNLTVLVPAQNVTDFARDRFAAAGSCSMACDSVSRAARQKRDLDEHEVCRAATTASQLFIGSEG